MKKNLKTPKVSVLIPAFNEEKYITKTLEAITKQDYPDLEVIVINNASTDRTEEMIRAFIEKNPSAAGFITVAYESRQGTNYARECGRKLATGAIIAQLDADCIPAPNWIEQGVRLLQENNVVVATGPYDYYDASFSRRLITSLSQLIFYPIINGVTQLFKRGAILIGGNSFVAADILEKAGGYNVNLTFYGDDIDIAKRVLPFGTIKFSNKLTLKTSSRRFAALGFEPVQKKYRKAFIDLAFSNEIKVNESREIIHPR
jgi:glycosyltransferase involved in cell wall biosynthesis